MSRGTRSIGARLKKLGYTSYAAYLASDHWQDVRRRFYASKLYHGCCESCRRSVPLQIHHRTYKRLGTEYLMDLVAVCGDCHKTMHAKEKGGMHLWSATNRVIRRTRRDKKP